MAKKDKWTREFLTAARQEGDQEADRLAARIMSQGRPGGGRLGYNLMLDLADVLAREPALALVSDSDANGVLGEFDNALRSYYAPMPAPAWVDPDRIRIGQEIWEKYPLPVIGVLYAASLPACYLIRRGIPALYQTEKLRDHKYIFQRIYETGVMLEDVMEPGGLQVLEDVRLSPEELLAEAMNRLDPQGKWCVRGVRIIRSGGEAGVEPWVSAAAIQQKVGELSHDRGSRRFLWGPGYLAARKVRMLHASMRFMLQHKARFSDRANRPPPHTLSERVVMEAAAGRPDWPTGQLGVPVNQEDLAYTLLTFAYVIPVGLDHWGAGLSAKQKDGFLHLWKVVGHVMGLREDLLPDDWDEARFLYESIQGSECGDSSRVPSTAVPSGETVPHDSEPGVVLTEAVMRFLEDYLPRTLGLNALIGAGLIRDQMGPELAGQLLPQKDFRRASSLASRLVMAGFRGFARCYFLLYREIAERIPLVSRLMENVFERAADELVNSWRDAYSRRPFYIPNTYNEWVRVPGADDAYLARLKDWRERVFVGVVAPLLTFFVALLSFLLWLVCLVLHPVWAGGFGWVSLGTFLATVFLSEVHLPRVYRARPKVPAAPAQPDVVNLTP